MSDYSGPYGVDHDPSEMATGADRAKERKGEDDRKRAADEERAAQAGRERPGDEGEGEDSGEQGRFRGAGGAPVTETPD
ncbi:hypothetical protein ACFSJS_25615 [Streptomyces desertarenae]|uniref:Uncharacterized protein n=1 Tax=Streptomyces desertarenae TaxID=2666184 RepID=A0ABW4PU08_9ACTN